ncbi:hypothetical protein EFA69_05465 [Rufibacter immobilis]|uniref:Uncharacterized protein n=1 Tax=Rufibacter immobilis TaxID=1348778 RepID=A0A3M9N2K1_9BACT|nr:hypothetical protein [Rufibacter immobilis]RNI31956.1 hypothetical protein EFA69_05465 [Rufibacter immobilis]
MPYTTDTKIEIELKEESKTTYIISSQHRATGNPKKTVWTIDFNEEVECFKQSKISEWIQDNYSWGVKAIDSVLQYIGHNFENETLKLAKFVDGNENDIWHGYPADYLRRSQDRPPTFILKSWVDKGYLTKAKMNKIRRGQPCDL